jgi:hypothetical protein
MNDTVILKTAEKRGFSIVTRYLFTNAGLTVILDKHYCRKPGCFNPMAQGSEIR